ncbi:MAG: hypothetical protein CMP61_06525 [Flavobacteriales bacterium]|nr:hypothetical protein [Flavobacteriales bacterium]
MNFCLKKRTIQLFSIVICCVLYSKSFSQSCPDIGDPSYSWPNHQVWFFGNGVLADFTSGAPSFSLLNVIDSFDPPTSYEGTATVSNESGELLWVSNGRRVWNIDGDNIHSSFTTGNEGDKLNGSAVQGILVTRHQLNPDVYHVFCTDDVIDTDPANEGLDYFTVNAKGEILTGPTTIQAGRTFEGVTATLHANGVDVWVMAQDFASGDYNAYLIDCNGLNIADSKLNQDLGIDFDGKSNFTRGSLEFSWDGTLMAQGHPAFWPVGDQEVSLYDFDNSSGLLSNPIHFSSDLDTDEPYDIEFSTDQSRLYFTTRVGKVGYYDISSGVQATMTNSRTFFHDFPTHSNGSESGLETGADGQIYINNSRSTDLFVISGASVNNISVGSDLNGTLGLPNMYIPPADSVKIQTPVGATDCSPINLETIWKCKGTSAENTPRYEDAYSIATTGSNACPTCAIDARTGALTVPGPGTYEVYFEICELRDTLNFTVGTCGCDADISSSEPICVGETFLLDTAVISSSGTGVWTIDSFPSNSGDDAIIKYGVDSTSSETVLSFDGQNDYVNIDQLASYLTGNNFTIEFWINTQVNDQNVTNAALFAVNAPAPGDNEFLITIGEAGTTGNETLNIYDQKNTVGSKFVIKSSNDISGGCTHIAYVRNGSVGEAFVNGVSVGTHTIQYNITASHRVSFGQEWDHLSESDFFKGSMWDVAVWNSSRTSADIKNDLMGNLIGNEPGLIAYYDANQGVPNQNNSPQNTLNDLSVNNLNGSLENFSLNGGASNFVYTPCKNIFDASAPNTKYGVYKLKFTVDNSCEDSMYVEVKKIPTVVVDQIGPFCDDSVAVVMTAIPANGGDVTGVWQIDNGTPFISPNFDPVALGPGDYSVKYGVDSLGCLNADSISVKVLERPHPEIKSVGPFCAGDGVVQLELVNAVVDSGVWSGEADSDGKFYPSTSLAGDHDIFYTISGLCGNDTMIQIHVDPEKDATITAALDTLVLCAFDANPTFVVAQDGGSWLDDNENPQGGVIQSATDVELDLTVLGAGLTNEMFVYVQNDPCGDRDTIWVTTTDKLDATIMQVGPFCDSDTNTVILDIEDPGGTFSGDGIYDSNTGKFRPSDAGDGIHTITYTISGNCGDVKTIDIEVIRTPDPTITNTSFDFCETHGDESLTSSEAGGTWSSIDPDNGALDAGGEIFNTETSSDGTFRIEYGFGGQCPAYDTITINVDKMPVITYTTADGLLVCEDDDPFQVEASATPSNSTLTWLQGTDASGEFTPAGNLYFNTILLQADNGLCSTDSAIIIGVMPVPNAFFNSPPHFCIDDKPQPMLPTETGGEWISSAAGSMDLNTGIFNPAIAGPGVHTIYHTIPGQCEDVFDTTLTVIPLQDPTITPPGDFCEGDAAFVLQTATSGGIWSGDVNSDGSFDPAVNGVYTAIYETGLECKDVDTITFTVNIVPETRFVGTGNGCIPLEISFSDASGFEPVQSTWYFDNEDSTNSIGIVSHTFLEEGCYDITLKNHYPNGCYSEHTEEAACAYGLPEADFYWEPNVLDLTNNVASIFDASSSDVVSLEYVLEDSIGVFNNEVINSSRLNDANPMVKFTSPNDTGGVVNVWQKVENSYGCKDSVLKSIQIRDIFSVYVPNAFTPNDDGLNETFFPKGRNFLFGQNYSFRIYNRWGTLIWKSNVPQEAWDGRVTELSPTSGEIAQIDVYVWRLNVIDPYTKDEIVKFGRVSLIK